MLARVSAFVVWALVAATAVFWGLRLSVRAPAAPAHTLPVGDSAALRGDLSRLLGAAPAPEAAAAPVAPELASRFKLLGIMAPKGAKPDSGVGVALLAVDGKPPRAFAVGARIDESLVLQSVSLRSASIGPDKGEAALRLELPPPLPPATGTLPAPGTTSIPALSLPSIPAAAPYNGAPALPGRPGAMPQRPQQPVPMPGLVPQGGVPPMQESGAPTQ